MTNTVCSLSYLDPDFKYLLQLFTLEHKWKLETDLLWGEMYSEGE